MQEIQHNHPSNTSPSLRHLQALGEWGAGIDVAIIDGAVDQAHPLLESTRIEQEPVSTSAITHHGTAVASQISGMEMGAAPAASLRCYAVFSESNGSLTGCSEIALANAINNACKAGCRIINISGSSASVHGHGTQQLRDSIAGCLEQNVLVIAAIGNDGAAQNSVPASLEGVLAVGAHDEHGRPAPFNNHGAKLRKKTILAPGVGVAVALKDASLGHISGTSFAAPLVTGIAALLARAIDRATGGTRTNAGAIRSILEDSAIPRQNSRGDDTGHQMAGCLNIDRVLELLLERYPGLTAFPTPPEQRYMNMEISDNSDAVMPTAPTPNLSVQAEITPAAEVDMAAMASTLALPGIDQTPASAFVHGKRIMPQAVETPRAMLGAEKVFAIGQLGYDFGTEQRLDYFTQVMGGSDSHPYDPLQLAKHLFDKQNVDQAAALIWTLKIDGIPIYALVPDDQFAAYGFGRLVQFLHDQERNGIERISIAGTITGETRLFNGQVVPSISPILRGMFNWKSKALAKATVEAASSDSKARAAASPEAKAREPKIEAFLNRIYYELRNRGAASPERALNYAATNAYQLNEVFDDAMSENLFLNRISAEPSPISRPDSDCWDVILEFFNPKERLTAARKLYRYTVDVSDVMPVTVGKLRSWHAY
jgi:cyanobactin maturation PatA/PatG family protease